MPKRLLTITGASLLLGLLFSRQLLAGGFTVIEMGTEKTGMMAGVAKPDDLSAVYHNPAGLADLRGNRLLLYGGFGFVDVDVRLKAWPTSETVPYGSEFYIDTPVDSAGYFEGTISPTRSFGAMGMLVASSDFGWKEGPVVAVSVFVPNFIGAFLPEDAPTRYIAVEGYFTAGVALFTAAYRLPEPLSFLAIGAGGGFLYVRTEGKRWFNVPTIRDDTDYHDTNFVIRMAGEDYRFFFNAGLCVEILPQLVLGLAVIGGTDVEMKGRLEVSLAPGEEKDPMLESFERAGEFQVEGTYRMRNLMKVPYGVSFGVNWAILPELELAADFRYWFYRTFEEQKMYHNIDIELLGRDLVENPLVTPKDYEDSWTLSAGVLGRPFAFPLELMAGWTYDHSPAPSHTKSLDSPTVNLTGFSLGLRYTLDDTWRLSLTYYHYWYLRDEITDSILDPPQNALFEGGLDTISFQMEVVF